VVSRVWHGRVGPVVLLGIWGNTSQMFVQTGSNPVVLQVRLASDSADNLIKN